MADPVAALEDGTGERFPFSADELATLFADYGTPDPPPMEALAKTISACARVANEFYYPGGDPNKLDPAVKKRIFYLDGIFNSCLGWNRKGLNWWFENIICPGAPDHITPTGEEVYLCEYHTAAAVETWVRTGRGPDG